MCFAYITLEWRRKLRAGRYFCVDQSDGTRKWWDLLQIHVAFVSEFWQLNVETNLREKHAALKHKIYFFVI